MNRIESNPSPLVLLDLREGERMILRDTSKYGVTTKNLRILKQGEGRSRDTVGGARTRIQKKK